MVQVVFFEGLEHLMGSSGGVECTKWEKHKNVVKQENADLRDFCDMLKL